jgi:hypothetical protein
MSVNKAEQSIEQSVAPFKVQQLAEIIMEKKNLSFTDALHYLYSSDLYNELFSEKTKWWYSSGEMLFEMIEAGKQQNSLASNRKMTLFYIFSLEHFKEHTGFSSERVLDLFVENKVFAFLEENFEVLHTQSKEYIVESISEFIKK